MGLLGGVIRCLCAVSLLPTGLWGIQKGKADGISGSAGATASRSTVSRELQGSPPVTRYLFRPVKRAVGLPGAR